MRSDRSVKEEKQEDERIYVVGDTTYSMAYRVIAYNLYPGKFSDHIYRADRVPRGKKTMARTDRNDKEEKKIKSKSRLVSRRSLSFPTPEKHKL